ncbi:hypothetical protein [Verminephrobacter aporrectodeae]|uniref:hypothetical protein n=1 Tax=Verminephrobacter aporrectodeae TaxID=1110389 RepID=UPI002238EC00|nr:hypothetical protein [Verminephrobacter aporrectodeae]
MKGKNPADAIKNWHGRHGIDGIYRRKVKDKDGNDYYEYVLVESKATGGSKNGVPDNTVEKLDTTKKGSVRQMSNKWIEDHLDKIVNDGGMSAKDKKEIMDGLKNGSTKRIYAQTDANGTIYHEITGTTKDGKLHNDHARVSASRYTQAPLA